MIEFIGYCSGIGGLVMLANLSSHDFADTRRVYIAFGLLATAIVCTLIDRYTED